MSENDTRYSPFRRSERNELCRELHNIGSARQAQRQCSASARMLSETMRTSWDERFSVDGKSIGVLSKPCCLPEATSWQGRTMATSPDVQILRVTHLPDGDRAVVHMRAGDFRFGTIFVEGLKDHDPRVSWPRSKGGTGGGYPIVEVPDGRRRKVYDRLIIEAVTEDVST